MKPTRTTAIIRALLLTGATGISLKLVEGEVQEWLKTASEWLTSQGKAHFDLWPWVLVVVLIGFALFFTQILGWLRATWFWLSHRYLAPLLLIGGFLICITIGTLWPKQVCLFSISLFLLFGATTWFFWPDRSADTVPMDRLHRKYFVRRLREIFLTKNTKIRRVAVIGTWGSGKTVILKLLRNELDGVSEIKFRTAFVNPWKARTPEEAWAILAKGFDEALGLPGPVIHKWWRHPLLTRIVNVLPIPTIAGDLFTVFAGSGGASDQGRVDRINRIISGRKLRLILMVDDMERAEPEVIRKMLPVIDRLCELQNCFFVFAIDRDRVAKAFGDDVRAKEESLGYLDKVFDLQLELPAPLEADIGEMCLARLNANEHPKLLACFADLKPLLPKNPRAAQKFLELAISKENLFLLRYRDDEHPYLPFFILWMLDAEFPGSIEILLTEEVERDLGSITEFKLFDKGSDEVESENFKRIVKAVVKKHGEASGRRAHLLLESLVRHVVSANDGAWLGRNTFNLRWAAYGHQRLLELAVEERTKLESRWINKAGTESIQEMLAKEFPKQIFSDVNRCAAQLIEMEVEQIEHAIRECYDTRTDSDVASRIGVALSSTKRLRNHFLFSFDKKYSAELFVFGEDFFRRWLEGIAQTPLEFINTPRIAELRDERFSLGYDLVRAIPIDRCYRLYAIGVAHIVDRGYTKRPKETEQHVEELRRKLLERVTNHVCDLFRSGQLPDDWDGNRVAERFGIDFLYEPQNWLPVVFGGSGLEPLSNLVRDADSSAAIANNFARIVQELFLEPLSRGFDRNRSNERLRIVELIKNGQTSYVRYLWKGAMSPLVEAELRDQLLKQRNQAVQHGRGEHEPPEDRPERGFFISDSTVEDLFPLRADFESLGIETEAPQG
ncbi:MAG: hypothetical protein JNJ70_26115 [Verrucomicrobiales bacterium]|nr:hypothetical protein [Verrucomicrobiales bacterium]